MIHSFSSYLLIVFALHCIVVFIYIFFFLFFLFFFFMLNQEFLNYFFLLSLSFNLILSDSFYYFCCLWILFENIMKHYWLINVCFFFFFFSVLFDPFFNSQVWDYIIVAFIIFVVKLSNFYVVNYINDHLSFLHQPYCSKTVTFLLF